jgi:hypothetical protein
MGTAMRFTGLMPDGETRFLNGRGEPIRHYAGVSTFSSLSTMPEAAVVKIPARAVRGVVTSKGSPIAPAAQVVKAPLTVKAAVKGAVKPLVKPQSPKTEWVPPVKGMSKPFQVGTVTYLRDHLNRLWTQDANGKPDDCVGVWDEKTQSIDDENVPDE